MADLLHYEDFTPGQVIDLGRTVVTAEDIRTFAAEFDPQPFHLDEDAAASSLLGGLSASGWHGCAILMRMMVDSYLGRSAGMGSSGLDEVKWLKPIRAEQEVHGIMTVQSCRTSSRRPELGIVMAKWELHDERGQTLLEMTGVNFIRVRSP